MFPGLSGGAMEDLRSNLTTILPMTSESQNIEWKKSWQDDYLKWICGFANAQGGRIYIGKEDTGKITDLKNVRKLLEDLPNKIRDQLGLMPQINLLQENEKAFLEIIVESSSVLISLRGCSGSVKQEVGLLKHFSEKYKT